MSLSNMLGQLMQQGLSGQTGQRMQSAMGKMQGGSLEQVFGSLLGGGQGGAASGMDLAGMAKQFLSQPQAGGLTGGQLGGLGALAGAVLGGGGGAAGGALGGGMLALLGTLAVNALKPDGPATPDDVPAAQAHDMTSEETAKLLLRAMVSAAQADGTIDKDEMQRIMGEAGKDGVSDAERQVVMEAMTQPADPQAIALAVPTKPVAAQVYVASLLAISIDTPQEQQYLRDLSAALDLDSGTVRRLHESVDAPLI